MRMPRFTAIFSAWRDLKRWRAWALEALLLTVIVGAVTVWQNRGLPEGAAPPLAGVRTDGSAVNVNAGGTTTLVVFWAAWCPVCKAEEDNITAVAKDWPVISVAMQSGDAPAVVNYLKTRDITLPAIVDEDGEIAKTWHLRGVPAHFIVDPAGNIRFRVVGYATTAGLRARLWWAERFPS